MIAAGVAAYLVLQDSGGGGGEAAAERRCISSPSNAYDPHGDGQENDDQVSNATDGKLTTSWETENYRGSRTFGNLKDGVGIVFDAGRPVKLDTLTVQSDTPGFIAEVQAGASSTGPQFTTVSSSETVARRTTFQLDVPAARRYYLLWITRLPAGVERTHVSEVTAG